MREAKNGERVGYDNSIQKSTAIIWYPYSSLLLSAEPCVSCIYIQYSGMEALSKYEQFDYLQTFYD